jgi:hypothetical protein
MTQHLYQHHQVMFNQQVQFKVLMVVKVDKVAVMDQAVVVELLLWVEMVVQHVLELLLEQVELDYLIQLQEVQCPTLVVAVEVHKVDR